MKKPNITDGEWRISRPKKSERLVFGENPDRSDALVCACEIDEDAKAISAVHEMIDALIEARSYFSEYVIDEEWEQELLEKIEQALKKAGCHE